MPGSHLGGTGGPLSPMKLSLLFYFSLVSWAAAATRVEVIRNEKVAAYNEIVAPGESEPAGSARPNITVYVNDGTVERMTSDGRPITTAVKRGEAVYRKPDDGLIRNVGSTELRLVRIDFLGVQSERKWGSTGLAPDYRVLLENGYARVYDIRIAAGATEPQHTHQDRVIIGLSGAQLKHLLPDGQTADSNLKTGEVAWRRGQTHIGENVGKTDLWAIAIEPK
jgi:hypothetical protein